VEGQTLSYHSFESIQIGMPVIISVISPATGRSRVVFMNITAASKAAGLPFKTVRCYAEIGLVEAPSRSEAE
jgi:hypothetical protein